MVEVFRGQLDENNMMETKYLLLALGLGLLSSRVKGGRVL